MMKSEPDDRAAQIGARFDRAARRGGLQQYARRLQQLGFDDVQQLLAFSMPRTIETLLG